MHGGNINANHRYSGPGSGAIYAGTTQKTALAEISHYVDDLSGKISITKQVSLNNVLDLTDASIRNKLGIVLDDIISDGYNITQKLGGYAKKNGFDGILAPSARESTGNNIILLNK